MMFKMGEDFSEDSIKEFDQTGEETFEEFQARKKIEEKTKYLTCKEWAKFDRVVERVDGVEITAQEIVCMRFQIILTDHMTRKEKTLHILGKFNMKNFDKGMKKFNNGVDKFNKTLDEINKTVDQLSKELDDLPKEFRKGLKVL